jgi:hypothetical protein
MGEKLGKNFLTLLHSVKFFRRLLAYILDKCAERDMGGGMG